MSDGTLNDCYFSGYVAADGDTYVTPSGEQIMRFDFVVIQRGTGERVPLKMRLEGDGFGRWGGLITRGRPAMLRCEARNVPIVRHGYVKGETTVFVVNHAEFPNRSKAGGTTDDTEGAEPKQEGVAA